MPSAAATAETRSHHLAYISSTPVTFLAGLDPSLREAVLLEQDDSFFSTLLCNLLPEVDAMRDHDHLQQYAI
ncbi:uncharacterized protein VP01_1271g5 [Puccinia sorghi]|uniref:Uncharacterized protein n=1 Tax=Puccinia sorghi TaxID=27349 RepID=A0A0L6VNX4_9BASI|nr:uncharacterized protein VP01_1271g5 [Puccinia sorghi]